MLKRTAAAAREVSARRRDAFMRWRDNFQEGCTVALFKRDAHALARQHIRHVERPAIALGNAVRLCAQRANIDLDLSHVCTPRSGIRDCHCRPR